MRSFSPVAPVSSHGVSEQSHWGCQKFINASDLNEPGSRISVISAIQVQCPLQA